ncbi:MAG TPA: hypothetical protein PKW41_11380 [Clostridia bacterium]|nr:hypothetical protein [Clostridia bacterium]HPK16588.1 hypothetical protein [Clostridia bacterium]
MSMIGQNFSCDTEECRYWHDEGSGCTLDTITIQEGRCCEMENRHRVCIHISGGILQSVYSDLDPAMLRVELYDSDNAKAKDAHAEARIRSELAAVSESLHQLY